MRELRRLLYPVRFASVRLASRPGRALVAAAGIAAAGAMLATVLAGTVSAQDGNLQEAVTELPEPVRALRAFSFGAPGQGDTYASLDDAARSALTSVLDRDPVATVLYRESTIGGEFVSLGAVDDLERWIRLRSGRLPSECTAERCEVVQVRGRGRVPNVPGLRLVRVGSAELRSGVLFGDALPIGPEARHEASLAPFYREASRYHRPAAPLALLANGVRQLESSPRLVGYRTYGWIVPIQAEQVHPWNAGPLVRRIDRAGSALVADSASFRLLAPSDELVRAADAADVAGSRLLLLGGQAAALLLAFAVFAAAKLRRDVEETWMRLRWAGATGRQLAVLTLAEAAAIAFVGVLVGWTVGAAAGAAVARNASADAGHVLRHSVASTTGLSLAVGLAVAATVLITASVAVKPFRLAGLALSPLDVAAVAALAAVGLALARGQADADALLRERGTGVLLVLLPGLVAFAFAVAVARALPPLLRALERAIPSSQTSLRIATATLARNPGAAAAAAAFLVVSLGLSLFAGLYRSTLERGQRDQAAFAVPADFVLREDLSRLIPVTRALAPGSLDALPRGASAERVLRIEASVNTIVEAIPTTVLGLDPGDIQAFDGWRGDFSALEPAELGARISPPDRPSLRGFPIPDTASTLALAVELRGRPLRADLIAETTRGDFVVLDLGSVDSGRRATLTARVPADVRGGRVIALHLDPPPRIEERGADAGRPARGLLALGPIVATTDAGREVIVSRYDDWIGLNGAEGETARDETRLRYTLTNQVETYFRPSQATDGRPVAIVASPRIAALADDEGQLPVEVAGERLVARVVATAQRFPGLGRDFVVADLSSMATALNGARPGAAIPNEIWVSAPDEALPGLERALQRKPFDALELRSRGAVERDLRDEPIARGSLFVLASAALVGLGVALLGIVLGVISDLRDERGELYDLEAQGATPSLLRRQVRLRAVLVAAVGILGGLATGALLSLLVVRLVTLAAGGGTAEPPLVLTLNWTLLALALAAGAVLGAALLLGVTARAFRALAPGRYGRSEA
jgi:hypothetical protein